jgi:RNA polymerase sigma-70 factor (ECF subfamily)
MLPEVFNIRLTELRPALARRAVVLTSSKEEAQDLLQETFYKALKYRERYTNEINFGGWVYTIMRNTFLNQKKRERLVRFRSIDETPSLANSLGHSLDDVSVTINNRELELAIVALDPSIRKPFLMTLEGFQYDEIALDMEIPIGTVKSRIFRARSVLSESLREPVLS